MKKTIIILAVIGLFVVIAFLGIPKESFDEELAGETRRVCYNSVNVRLEPSDDSEIIGEKHLGNEVTLTGNVMKYPLEEVHSKWLEITEGGWIVSDALMHPWYYEEKFN